MLTRLSSTILVLFLGGLIACSSTPGVNSNSPEGAFKLGEKYEKDERFEDAINQFSQVKNKFPYSKLATESELRIADIHFKREEFIESESAYQTFKELHPSHPRSGYVTYRMGLSYYNQLPGTIDRDLSTAEKAITAFDEVLRIYAGSEYAKEAAESRHKALKMLADKEYYVANYYFIRKFYESSLSRFEALLEHYPHLGLDAQALYGAAISAARTDDMARARGYLGRLNSDYQDSAEAEKARRELGSRI